MLDTIKDGFKFIIIAIAVLLLVVCLIVFICAIVAQIPIVGEFFKERDRINKEWNQKVNSCVCDSNYRKDCNLILYKDKQINENKNQDSGVYMYPVIVR